MGQLVGSLIVIGQACTATGKIFKQSVVYEEFLRAFPESIREVSVVGDPFEEGTKMEPFIMRKQFERVLGHGEVRREEGARLNCRGIR